MISMASILLTECEALPAARRAITDRYSRLGVPIFIWILTAIYLGGFLNRFWIPHDDGLLAQTAERVLDGELPHRDFDDTYTGGLAYLHALAFKLLGIRLTSMRLVLYAFTLLFVPAVYSIAVRMASPWLAGLVTVTCVVWSVPNYFAGLPSWYILFFTTFGVVALLRYVDTGRTRWLWAAGICGGLALLIKIVALYYVAAVLLFLCYREQLLSAASCNTPVRRSWSYFFLVTLAAALFTGLLVALIHRDLRPMEILNYIVPGAALVGVLVWSEWQFGRGAFLFRLRRITTALVPFCCGVALPVALFLAPYVASGALPALYHGVFVLPMKRIGDVAFPLRPITYVEFPAAIVLGLWLFRERRFGRVVAVVAALPAAYFVLRANSGFPYAAFWHSMRYAMPFAVVPACLLLLRGAPGDGPSLVRRQEVFLLAAIAAMLSLLQYPFAHPIYFCYTAPLVILAVTAVVQSSATASRPVFVGLLIAYSAFATLWMNSGNIYALGKGNSHVLGRQFVASLARSPLTLDRAGLIVSEKDERQYPELVAEIERRTRPGSFIYATPDCPEVYFLSSRRNPTRTFFELFDDPVDRTAKLMRLLDEKQVELVVQYLRPKHSRPISEELAHAITARYPESRQIGDFVVAWKIPQITHLDQKLEIPLPLASGNGRE